MNASVRDHEEAQLPAGDHKRGGWITFPFILAVSGGVTLASWGWSSNIIVYLIEEFQVKSIIAAQISNLVNGCGNLIPVIGAIIADSSLGCFSVAWISSFISLLGTVILALTATLKSLRPQPRKNGLITCQTPSPARFAVLYGGIALATIGYGGMRTTISTMGANQFSIQSDQEIYFNWYYFNVFTSSLIGTTALVYVQDNVSWGLGFGLSVAANLLGLAIFLLGSRFYIHVKPQGSPFISMARVIVATTRKWKALLVSSNGDNFFYYGNEATTPTESFRFLNRAAMITEGDTKYDGSIAKPWKLCTVQQVEDFKSLIRILPLWSTGILLSTAIGVQGSLMVLQALTMDRHLGTHFKISAGSIQVFSFISTSLSLIMFDPLLWPMWQKIIGKSPRPLQRIGVGHVLNALAMAVAGLVEIRRLNLVHSHRYLDHPHKSHVVPMSVLWLVPQLAMVGIGAALHFPGQVTLYYQEFPKSLKSLGTAMISLQIGIGFYLSTAFIDLVQRATGWLPDSINNGRLDNVYWVIFVIAAFNFGYYLLCSCLYKYKNVEKVGNDSSGSGIRQS